MTPYYKISESILVTQKYIKAFFYSILKQHWQITLKKYINKTDCLLGKYKEHNRIFCNAKYYCFIVIHSKYTL